MGRRWDSRPLAERLAAEWEVVAGAESMTSFCARKGVRVDSFRRWRRWLATKPAAPTSGKSGAHPSFVEVTPIRSDSFPPVGGGRFVAEIVTPRGYTVRVGASMSALLLRELLVSC
jgi:hypothetical protein